MQVVQLLVSSDGIHIRIDTISRLNFVFSQSQSFPFRQRVYHLSLSVAKVFYRERHRTLHAIQVVVDTQTLHHEQRSRDTLQSKLCRKVLLEEVLYLLYAQLGLTSVEQRFVTIRFNNVAHIFNVCVCNLLAKVIIYY